MKIKAQMGMVLNLDKCLGCHTCNMPCKNTWTTAPGTEYMWFNNVETKPGIGYPRQWEDQKKYKGGWHLHQGKLTLRAGGKLNKFLNIFANPHLPELDDYYEPWDFEYDKLISSPASKHQPTARAVSAITGDPMTPQWGPNWEDDLAGTVETGINDVNFDSLEAQAYLQYKQVFMMHLPRLCEHCLNPACVASCPSGAMYKRDEDGIVLVDQERCRSWRYCVSGCPYKKVYFNWKTHHSEKCIFCYPRIEAGLPTLCAHSCVGRLRYIGVMLYDADAVHQAAATPQEKNLYEAQIDVFLNPHDPAVIREAEKAGIPHKYIEAAKQSPIYKLAVEWRLALPLHPEFRTLPMVWYIPPTSPLVPETSGTIEAHLNQNITDTSASITERLDNMRIPMRYLANLLTAGDETPVRSALTKLIAMRHFQRAEHIGKAPEQALFSEAGLDADALKEMYRLLALARYDERFVIPTAHRELGEDVWQQKGSAGFSQEGK